MERIDKLKQVLQILLEVRNSFSNEEKRCDHCNMITFLDWNEKQMRDQINGAISRVEKVIDRLKRLNEQV
jgi:hypothetical protein